jgi:peptidoglycan/xylan/chitin deacetylase (PgdA/CDA1 family)
MTLPGKIGRRAAAVARAAAGTLLRRVPISLWRRLRPKPALGVCYHMVSDHRLPHLRHYPYLSPASFDADLDYLQRHFGCIAYADLAARRAAAGGGDIRDNAAILTFDDGFAECASVVAPALRRRGLGGVFFVITDLIDNATMFRESEAALCIEAIGRMPAGDVAEIARDLGLQALPPPPRRAPHGSARRPLDIAGLADSTDPRLHPLLHWLLTIGTADLDRLRRLSARLGVAPDAYLRDVRPYLSTAQIRALHADGFVIGAHGCSHRLLQGLPPEEAEREIVQSCRVVRDITGQESVPFAFPYFGGDIDRAWLAALRRRHPMIGLLFDTDGLREDEPFVVQRVFGERFGHDRTLDATLRRAWARPAAWRRRPPPYRRGWSQP